MISKKDWPQTMTKWKGYWQQANKGRPLMCVVHRKPEIEDAYQKARKEGTSLPVVRSQGFLTALPPELMYKNMDEKYRDPDVMVKRYRFFCETHDFLAESYPSLNVDFGPGSVAAYLGSEIVFRDDTVWFEPCVTEWEDTPPFVFDPSNAYFKEHLALVARAVELAGDDFRVQMPDLMEGIDVISAMRGTQETAFDIIDEPEEIQARIAQINTAYFEYYNRFHALVDVHGEHGNGYTVFQIWGPGKTAKLQCDFSTMISPANFREFIQQPLREQAAKLDTVLYHLDGPDSIRHMDALMEIDEINALQWTSGDHGPDGAQPEWDVIYDKARAAGKSIWVKVYTGGFEDWLQNAHRLVMRYGSHSTFFHFPEMSKSEAERLMEHAEKHWTDVEGTFGE